MSKQKVRPMVDKDLRDEIVNYCGGGESFNSALRHYAKEMHSLHGQVNCRERQNIELMKKNTELSAKLDEAVSQRDHWLTRWYEARNDLLLSSKRKKIHAIVIVFAWVVIGAELITLFLA